MNLIEIYCLGVVTQALYYLIKRLMWDDKKVSDYKKGISDLEKETGLPVVVMAPFLIGLMCLLWPYILFERLFLKR